MAQTNPINESASYSTGGANAPLNTSSDYGTKSTSTHPTSSTSTSTTGSKLNEATLGVKDILAGEKLRSEFNSSVDQTFNEGEGVAKNERIASEGDSEMMTGEFSHATKNREGVVPGDYERRRP